MGRDAGSGMEGVVTRWSLDASTFALSSTGSFAVVRGWSRKHNQTRLYRIELEPSTARGRATDLGKGPYGSTLALSPDDQTLLAVSYRESALWSLATNQPVPSGHAIGGARSAVITRSHIILDRKDGLRLLDRQTLASRGLLGSPGRGIRTALRLGDGSIAIASEGRDPTLFRWLPKQPERLVTVGQVPYRFGTRAGRLVGLFGRDNCATAAWIDRTKGPSAEAPLWKICTSDRLSVGRFGGDPYVAAADFERGRVAVQDGAVFVHDANTGQRTKLAGSDAYKSLRSASFSAGGRYFLAVAAPPNIVPERVVVWEVASGKLLHRLQVNERFAGFPAASRDESRVAAAWGKQAHLFDLATGRELKTEPLPSFTVWLRLDPHPNEFVVRTRIGRARFDASLTPIQQWSGWRVQPVADGSRLAFLLSGEQRLATLELTKDGHVVYTPRGSYASSGSPPNHLYWVDPESGSATRLTDLPGKNDPTAVRNALLQP